MDDVKHFIYIYRLIFNLEIVRELRVSGESRIVGQKNIFMIVVDIRTLCGAREDHL